MSDLIEKSNATSPAAADSLISLAISKDVDMDRLRELIQLRNNELERQSKLLFDRNFAEMQKEFKPVPKKNAVADREGNIAYRYASLDDILAVYQPIISGHGFGYRFEQEERPGNITRIVCIVSGYGHETRSFSDVPLPEMTRMTNAVQQRGSAITYAKRYAFCNAFGVMLADDDDDGRGASVKTINEPIAMAVDAVTMSPEDQKRHDDIKAMVDQLFSILLNDKFTVAERKDFKTKVNIGKANTDGYKKYVQTLLAEYQHKLDERNKPDKTTPEVPVTNKVGEPINPAVAQMFTGLKKEMDKNEQKPATDPDAISPTNMDLF